MHNLTSNNAERRCAKIASRLQRPTKKMRLQGINATIDVNNCKSSVKLIAGWLNIKALKWVSETNSLSI